MKTVKETLIYSNYQILEETPSQIDPTGVTAKCVGFRCPSCKTVHPPLDHWQETECECGLRMRLSGNALTCEMSPTAEWSDLVGES